MMLSVALTLLALQAGSSGPPDDPISAKRRTLECRNGDTILLRVRVSSSTENLLTAVTLPDLVENVVSSWSDRDLSVEVHGAKLFLKLLAKAEGHLDVVTTAGMHVRIYVKPAAPGVEHDGHVVLTSVPDKVTADASRKLPDALELVKAMRLGTIPPGASVKRGGERAIALGGDIEGRVAFVYETAAYRGYVLRITNASPSAAFHLDVTRFSAPRLVLAGAKSLAVAPRKSTFVFLVLWK